jgi:hypothetical protein
MQGRPISNCNLPWRSMVIGPVGEVLACCFTHRPIGNLASQTVEEIWNGPKMVRLRGSIRDGYIDPICRNASCSFVQDTERAFGIESHDFRCNLNRVIRIRGDDAAKHCVFGWSPAEYWGIWSDGPVATLYLDLVGTFAQYASCQKWGVRFDALCRGACHAGSPTREVQIFVNGRNISIWRFSYPHESASSAWRALDIPGDLVVDGRLEIRFQIDEPQSALLWNANAGKRLLGIALSNIKVSTSGPAAAAPA